ncbi:MAG TPA: FAD-dependent oxidoreductase [Solirubrobacteraceae bacterium]
MSKPIGYGIEEPENRNGAFPRLNTGQRALLRSLGTTRQVQSGEVLFREGDAPYDLFVVESGAVAIVQGYGVDNRVIAVHGPHRFLGELNLLTGSPAQLSAVVRDAGEVIQVGVGPLRKLVSEKESFSNLFLTAFLARRSILIDMGAGVKLVGSRYSRETRALREFLARNRMPFQWVDLEDDSDASEFLDALGVTPEETPVVLASGQVLRNPSSAELSGVLGIGARGAPPDMCDVIIVGGGPAGLSAALYGASEGLDTQAVDSVALGGQASTSARIENYLGFPTGISGSELAERATLQAKRFGARLVVPAEAQRLVRDDGHYTITLSDGSEVNGRTVIVATGARYNKLEVPRLEDYEGFGVYYAATAAEAQMCVNDPVIVVGGGNSAGQAAMFLSRAAGSCRLMIRGDDLAKSMSRYLINEIEGRDQIEVMTHTEVVALNGEEGLQSVILRDSRTGAETESEAKALFVFIGASPHTEWLGGQVACDEDGFLLAGRDLQEDQLSAFGDDRPLFLETSKPGIFAVGDVHSGSVKRVASAVGEGSMAVRLVHQRLAAGPPA